MSTGALLPAQEVAPPSGTVRPGIEVFLSDVPARIRGTRVGLITIHAGIDRVGTPAIDLIAAHDRLKLVALFAAEHGIRGSAAAGEKIAHRRDPPAASEAVRVGPSIDRLTGSDEVRLAIEGGTLPRLLEDWDRDAEAFRERRKPFLLYQ